MTITCLLASLNSCMNPWIYIFFVSNVRLSVSKVTRRCPCRLQRSFVGRSDDIFHLSTTAVERKINQSSVATNRLSVRDSDSSALSAQGSKCPASPKFADCNNNDVINCFLSTSVGRFENCCVYDRKVHVNDDDLFSGKIKAPLGVRETEAENNCLK